MHAGSLSFGAHVGSQFTDAFKKVREQAGLSQIELSRKSGVSPKTIANLEKGGTARFDAIVRLAKALQQSPQDWLRLAGISVSPEKLRKILSSKLPQADGGCFRRLESVAFMKELIEQSVSHSILMTICVTARMPVRDAEVMEVTKQLLESGLRLAAVCPFPVDSAEWSIPRPRLSAFYSQALAQCVGLAEDVRALVPEHPTQVRVFQPAHRRSPDQKETELMVMPPARFIELRPILLTLKSKTTPTVEHQLTFYVRHGDDRPDEWVIVDPFANDDRDEQARAEETVGIWRDFFRGITDSWRLAENVDGDVLEKKSLANWQEWPE